MAAVLAVPIIREIALLNSLCLTLQVTIWSINPFSVTGEFYFYGIFLPLFSLCFLQRGSLVLNDSPYLKILILIYHKTFYFGRDLNIILFQPPEVSVGVPSTRSGCLQLHPTCPWLYTHIYLLTSVNLNILLIFHLYFHNWKSILFYYVFIIYVY